MYWAVTVALAAGVAANIAGAVEVLASIGYCARRRVFYRVRPAGLTAAGRSVRPDQDGG